MCHLGLQEYRDPEMDECYCGDCYTGPDKAVMGTCEYIVPAGWAGVGIRHPARRPRAPAHWSVTYHGTKADRIENILLFHRIGIPGDRLPDGYILTGGNSAGRNDAHYCTAPCAAYAGLQLYAAVEKFGEEQFGGQTVFQVKQNQNTLKKTQVETMGYKEKGFTYNCVCPHTKLFEDGVEILSTNNHDCIIIRLLIRTFELNKPPDKDNCGGMYETFRCPKDRPTGTPRHDGSLWL